MFCHFTIFLLTILISINRDIFLGYLLVIVVLSSFAFLYACC